MKAERANARDVILPLAPRCATAGAVECNVAWADDTVTITTNRRSTPRRRNASRCWRWGWPGALLLPSAVLRARARARDACLVGGLVALAVYFMTLKKTSGGLAADFLRRLGAAAAGGGYNRSVRIVLAIVASCMFDVPCRSARPSSRASTSRPGTPCVAVAAEELHGERGHLLAHLRGEELGHGGLADKRLLRVLEAARRCRHEPRRLEIRSAALRDLELHTLKSAIF